MTTFPVPTLALYAAPQRMLALDRDWSAFSVEGFSKAFTWEQDPMSGVFDTLQPVEHTLGVLRGDCEDYAAVVASWLVATTDKPVYLSYLWSGFPLTGGHTVVHTADTVYSSGLIVSRSLTEFKAQTKYTQSVTRTINS